MAQHLVVEIIVLFIFETENQICILIQILELLISMNNTELIRFNLSKNLQEVLNIISKLISIKFINLCSDFS